LLVVLIGGLAGGLATGLVAGAARTRSAGDRLIQSARVVDLMVAHPALTTAQADEIRRLPGVQGAALHTGVAVIPESGEFLNITANVDGRHGVDIDRARIIRGRAADPDAADEIVVGEVVASYLGVDVGDVLRFDSASPEQVAAWQEREPTPEEMADLQGPTVDLEVVGVSRHPVDLSTDDPVSFFTALPPGFWDTYRGRVGEWGFRFVSVDLGPAPSAEVEEAVADAALGIVGPDAALMDAGEESGGPLLTTLDFVASGMVALAVAVGAAGLVVVGLVILRAASRAGDETAVLPALGLTRRGRAAAVVAAMAPAAAGAGGIALVASLASSVFMPFGLAGRVEPDPGLRFDGLMAVGAILTGVAVLGIVAAAAIGVATVKPHTATRGLPGPLSRLLGQAPSADTTYGLHLALGRGRSGSRAASRVGITGVVVAAAAGVASLVLVASVDHVFSTPAAYGWTWDYVVPDQAAAGLAEDPEVESVGVVTAGPITFEGRPLLTRGIESLKGEPPVLLVAGRYAGPGEVVLGARTMADLGVGIGDSVVAEGTQERRELRVVGEAVLAGVVDVPEAGWGAAMPLSQFEALGSEDQVTSGIVALADGADRVAFTDRLTAELGEPPSVVEEPVELARLREIEAFPRVLALFLAVVGLVSATYAVVVTARQRRPELAVLRAMGMGRRGVYRALSLQAGLLAVLGAGLGVPLGIAAGQAVWRNVAGSLGVVVTVEVPWTTVLLGSVAACAVVSALAFLPARAAVRLTPAQALRAE
jgi:putative ABC transport system permease protein